MPFAVSDLEQISEKPLSVTSLLCKSGVDIPQCDLLASRAQCTVPYPDDVEARVLAHPPRRPRARLQTNAFIQGHVSSSQTSVFPPFSDFTHRFISFLGVLSVQQVHDAPWLLCLILGLFGLGEEKRIGEEMKLLISLMLEE